MKIGIPREVQENENRVACTPEETGKLIKLGHEIAIEAGAGTAAGYTDEAYAEAGATLIETPDALWHQSEMILKVRAPQPHPGLGVNETSLLTEGKTLISFMAPGQNAELLENIAANKASALAVEAVPRISRAQKMDALSSMANIAGYRAVIEAGQHFGRFFTGQITAAGKVPPAKVMVIGAGVAGLAAIGAAVSLGAIVRAFDTRPEVKEQIESMSAEFLELEFEEDGSGEGGYAKTMSKEFIDAEMALFLEQAREVDIIITTALIPGKPAPNLITTEMVEAMKPGSVIVDLAAEQGGNCEQTSPGEVVKHHGVTIVGYTDFPSKMATQSSQLYATNLRHLLTELTPEKDGEIVMNMEDEVIRSATVVHDGTVTWPPPPVKLSAAPAKPKPAPAVPVEEKTNSPWGTIIAMAVGGIAILAAGSVAPASFMNHFIVFVLACFVGFQVIWNVTPALHTPLMSVTNAISGIIVIGALLQVGSGSTVGVILAVLAVALASINIAGGFLVTQRMLKMFQK
ncbi:MAG: Re/Si-specific NAD(P)(+) transhydrogenase subunit alpha [Acidiferrobacterales bacterium]|nr:Re/Si-specific NAD(P)(+) transhydrogenase subunit alpha [Acidiferrobacterales bacterium]